MTYLRTNRIRPNALTWPLGLGDLEKQLDTLFAGLPGFFDVQEGGSPRDRAADAKLRWYEKADAYLVRVDLPGVKKEDLKIELEDGVVTVTAVRKFEAEGEGEEAKELTYSKAFRVPDGVQAGKISAGFESGVLSLTLPKSEKVQPRQISVG
ncbi:Hsp20/alpha crystallin family protein [Pelagicoccus enzymogenes]|uniref:Hsp20/alpha crystallin family protein n=1 Tax=Pelagicoccus enzymogenes TaxID=2773457 RepID=UPI00280FFF01|nr:Hsp20/alpha crystallin family protein [Pelagicoccus enzymogenes]MDQ8196991.1 Hsp20/alpha crystallin family protein [Pelagicoccus enzymogenes]